MIFGRQTIVTLFGSRVKDDKKGGDIDFYIEPKNRDTLYEKNPIFDKTKVDNRFLKDWCGMVILGFCC